MRATALGGGETRENRSWLRKANPLKKLPSNYRPSGAIFVTTLVTVVTLVLWFGTYILNVLRG